MGVVPGAAFFGAAPLVDSEPVGFAGFLFGSADSDLVCFVGLYDCADCDSHVVGQTGSLQVLAGPAFGGGLDWVAVSAETPLDFGCRLLNVGRAGVFLSCLYLAVSSDRSLFSRYASAG